MALTHTETLPSGLTVTLRMPNLMSILSTVGPVPAQHIIDAVNLLSQDRVFDRAAQSLTPEQSIFARRVQYIKGKAAICQLCIVAPEGVGPDDLTEADRDAIYYGFFRGYVRRDDPGAPTSADPDPGRDSGDSAASTDVGA